MATTVVKAPAGTTQGAVFQARDGTQYIIGAGGLVTIDVKYLNDAIAAGFQTGGGFQGSVNANVTANANTGQANGPTLAYGINQIATVGAAAASVQLPAAVPGTFVTVINDGANTAQVFGTGSDTINGAANNVGIPQMQQSEITYVCVVAGQWRAIPGVGFSGGFETNVAANGIASNGTTQVGATLLAAMINRVTTVGATNGAILLPVSAPGMQITVTNANGANAANVFPAVNETINALAANGGFNLATGKTVQFTCAVAGQWHGILSA